MANTRELRRRIKSVKNTAQITKAMQMVAATKMRRAQSQAVNGRPYSENLGQALQRLLAKVETKVHPLLLGNDAQKMAVILLSTDKGLVGALNTNLMRTVASQARPGSVVYYTVGKKGRQFVAKTGQDLQADFENLDQVSFRQAVQLSKLVSEAFLSGEIGEAYIIYPHFVSTLRQEARQMKVLPIKEDSLGVYVTHPQGVQQSEFLFEPNVDALLDYILIHHLQIKIYQALLETKASEHSARMMAMQNATDNALDLVDDLLLTYNQTRQDAITNELLEITTAQAAME